LLFLLFILSLQTQLTGQRLQSETDSMSYYLGVLFAAGLDTVLVPELNTELIMSGISEQRAGNATVEPSSASMYVRGRMMEAQERIATARKREQDAYLEENFDQPGVRSTASGLQYKVLEPGSGASPTDTNRVRVHYTGQLIDGTVFDSSVERGEPAEFGVTQVIAGWTEGLKLMQEGARFRFFIPSELGYGARAQGADIPANSTLIFDVELLEIL
jgi:FKBP-type peptidyl-prolyl cis-trans isomerase